MPIQTAPTRDRTHKIPNPNPHKINPTNKTKNKTIRSAITKIQINPTISNKYWTIYNTTLTNNNKKL